jgi:tRNA threonylcarbamoyladenosine biosynthesis protein TsaB
VVLVIDTSSVMNAVALVDSGAPLAERVTASGRGQEIEVAVNAVMAGRRVRDLDDVAAALGPGSFTGVRVGVAYALGLAMGLGVPFLALGTLEIQRARARVPATAVSDAGRGRAFWLAPDGRTGLAEPDELPRGWPFVGWVKNPRIEVLPERDLRTFGEAVAELAGRAERVPYGSVRPVYMAAPGTLA